MNTLDPVVLVLAIMLVIGAFVIRRRYTPTTTNGSVETVTNVRSSKSAIRWSLLIALGIPALLVFLFAIS